MTDRLTDNVSKETPDVHWNRKSFKNFSCLSYLNKSREHHISSLALRTDRQMKK